MPDIEEHVTKGPRTRAAGAAAGTPRSALSCALDERVCTHLVRLLVLCHRAGREAADDGVALEPVWLLARVCRIHIRVCVRVCVCACVCVCVCVGWYVYAIPIEMDRYTDACIHACIPICRCWVRC